MEIDISILYKEYYKALYRYIYMMTLNSFDTEDILQNVFIKAMKGLRGFRGDSSIKTWLFTIARNECLDHLSKNRKEIQTDHIDILASSNYLEEKAVMKEAVLNIIMYIKSREEPVKSLLFLRLVEEKSFVEIGKIIGKSDVWCRINFFRAKKVLVELLEDSENAEGKCDER